MRWRDAVFVGAAIVAAAGGVDDHRDRRIVDTVMAGNAASEALHGYAGTEASTGTADGASYRTTRGWMRYALKTFDDTEVTVACTFVQADVRPGAAGDAVDAPRANGQRANAERRYDVVVEDSVIATRTVDPSAPSPTVVEFTVPFTLTKGRTSIAVLIRAHGGPTPALRELRIIQDHNEDDALLHDTTDMPHSHRATR